MGPAGWLLLALVPVLASRFILPEGNFLRAAFFERFPHFLLHTVVRTVCGRRGVEGVQAFWHYLVNEPNPVLQSLYLLLVSGGFFVGLTEAFVFVPNPYIASYHKGVFIAIFAVLMFSFYKVGSVPPGYITHNNHHKYNRYPYDLKLYFPSVCPTEKFIKPARSKFDRVSQRTVARFDHFCVWVAQPVGERNYKYFLFFLFMTCVYMLYAVVQVGTIFYFIIDANELMNATFINQATGEEVHASFYVLYSFLSSKYRLLFVSWATCVVMGGLVTVFFLWHVYMAARNRTTNEASKISQFKRSLKKAQEVNAERQVREAMLAAGKPLPEGLPELPAVPKVYQMQLDSGMPYVHTYDRGVWANLKEILFPRCYEPDANYPNAKRLIPPTRATAGHGGGGGGGGADSQGNAPAAAATQEDTGNGQKSTKNASDGAQKRR